VPQSFAAPGAPQSAPAPPDIDRQESNAEMLCEYHRKRLADFARSWLAPTIVLATELLIS
jgi:hypothetical protein